LDGVVRSGEFVKEVCGIIYRNTFMGWYPNIYNLESSGKKSSGPVEPSYLQSLCLRQLFPAMSSRALRLLW